MNPLKIFGGMANYFQRGKFQKNLLENEGRKLDIADKALVFQEMAAVAQQDTARWRLADLELRTELSRNAGRRDDRRIRIEERLAELREVELGNQEKWRELERQERKEADRVGRSWDIAREHWPLKVEPEALLAPASIGGHAPVTLLFRAPTEFEEQSVLLLEDTLRGLINRHYSRVDAERPVRVFWSDNWLPAAPKRGTVGEMLHKHCADNPTITIEMLRIGRAMVVDVATWGFDPVRPDPPAIGELGRFDWQSLKELMDGDEQRVIEMIAPSLALSVVTVLDACHMRRNLIAPIGPNLIGELSPANVHEAATCAESMRLQYNQIAEAAPEITNEVKLMLGLSLAQLDDQTVAKHQALELLDNWAPEGVLAKGIPIELVEGLANLLDELGEGARAGTLKAARDAHLEMIASRDIRRPVAF